MTQANTHLVGRADELGVLDEALGELARGLPGAIELVGEPGIGKTRLLVELARLAEARACLVLSGSASELEQELPFSVFVDALDEYLQGLVPEALAGLDDDVRTELADVFPALSRLRGGRQSVLQAERFRSHRAVRKLLERLASSKPLVLILDDVHWGDPASIELLGTLLRRPPDAAVLIALAVRPRQLPERLAAALDRAHHASRLTRIDLGALTSDQARELLGETVDASAASVLYEESGGNPFYLEQLARSLERAGGRAVGVPSTVAASLSEELALLSAPARRVLEGAAVAGDPFEPELAAAAADTSETATMEAVDELLARDLVRETDVPRRFRFRHPLVRRAVYDGTPGGWRLGAHERCAEVLAARGASAAARAHHVERSAREGDAAAIAVLREAAEEATRLAPASAARWFGDALRLLPRTAPVGERIELLVARAGALTATGRYSDSHADLVGALEMAPADDHALRARLARACAGVESLLGRQEDAGMRLVKALDELPDDNSPEAVALMTELAVNQLFRTRFAEMHETAERAVGAARRLGDRSLTAAALSRLALAASMMGTPDLAEAHRSEAEAIVDSLPDDELAHNLDAGARLAGVELYLDRYVEADTHATRTLALARATGQGEHLLVLVQILGGVWRQRGMLAEAGELLDGGIEAARVLGNTHALVWSLAGRSSAALRMGDLERALAAAEESVDLGREDGGSFHSSEAAAGLASVLLETGEPERAVDLLLGSAGGEELVLIAGSPRAGYLEVLARCWLELGREPEARLAAEAAQRWAAAVQLPMAAAWADRAAAAVSLYEGDTERAAELARASAARADEVGAPVEAAFSRLLAGRALAEAGDGDGAATELELAARAFEGCGALRYRDAAEQELGKLGHRKHRRTRPGKRGARGIDSLTGRELQVARLVVDRKTNPEIATELFLSKKTVETHLRNIFRKLGVSSRVDLARAVELADRAGEQALADLRLRR
jgi:ATP/maltotriose-dependent transcriptional regulator MalT